MDGDAASVPDFAYVAYIRAEADQVWKALTDADLTAKYWGHANVSDWRPGSTWEHRRIDGSGELDAVGRVVAAEPPSRLVMTFGDPAGSEVEPSRVTFRIEPGKGIVRFTTVHERLADLNELSAVSLGWPAVLSNLKTLLETGKPLPQEPWLMP